MSLVKALTASAAVVSAGNQCKLYSISFSSDDEDIHVKLRTGGVVTGTVIFYLIANATVALGDAQIRWHCGDKDGVDLNDGLYLDFTNNGAAAAGTGTINVEYL